MVPAAQERFAQKREEAVIRTLNRDRSSALSGVSADDLLSPGCDERRRLLARTHTCLIIEHFLSLSIAVRHRRKPDLRDWIRCKITGRQYGGKGISRKTGRRDRDLRHEDREIERVRAEDQGQ